MSDKTETRRIAAVGGWGHHYLAKAVMADNFPVEAAASAAPEEAERARQRFGDKFRWFEDPEVMLDEFQPEAVGIGTVYADIGPWVIRCLERNIPVVAEKPVASNWDDFHRIRKLLQDDPSRRLITEFPFRNHPGILALREAVQNGDIGTPTLITGQKSYRFGSHRPPWYADRSRYPGTILWVASHAIDMARFAGGQRFVRVTGRQGNVTRPDYGSMEDHTVSVFEMENGGTAVVHADYLRPDQAATHGDDRLRVAGSNGIGEWREGRTELVTHGEGPREIAADPKQPDTALAMWEALWEEEHPLYNSRSSLELAAILLAARDAADRGTTEEIPSV